jgi:hypothetical protein
MADVLTNNSRTRRVIEKADTIPYSSRAPECTHEAATLNLQVVFAFLKLMGFSRWTQKLERALHSLTGESHRKNENTVL